MNYLKPFQPPHPMDRVDGVKLNTGRTTCQGLVCEGVVQRWMQMYNDATPGKTLGQEY